VSGRGFIVGPGALGFHSQEGKAIHFRWSGPGWTDAGRKLYEERKETVRAVCKGARRLGIHTVRIIDGEITTLGDAPGWELDTEAGVELITAKLNLSFCAR